jgi:hypothetical protein
MMIPTSFSLCVVCTERFPRGVPGGPGPPPPPPPGYVQRSGKRPKLFFWAVFAILADFAIFSSFLN